MGVLISKNDDNQLYNDAYDEAQRIIRISEEIRLSTDSQAPTILENQHKQSNSVLNKPKNYDKITTAKLAEKFNIDVNEFTQLLHESGYIEIKGKNTYLTDKGRAVGGEVKKGQFGYFIVWSVDLDISFDDEKQSFADKLFGLFRL